MLVILSELNCIDKLNNHGIYPDKFYTDVDAFRNSAISFSKANIIIIFAGSCSFNKKHTLELVKSLKKREANERDNGITNVFVLSDSDLPLNCDYFRFETDIFDLTLQSGKRNKGAVDFWGSVSTQKKEAELYLSSYDKGVYDENMAFHKRASSEESLIRLIKTPDVKQMLRQSAN